MTNKKDEIAEFLDLSPLEVSETESTEIVEYEETNNDSMDYVDARNSLKNTIDTMTTAVEELAVIATQSQHPRTYDALTNAAKALTAMNKELLEIKRLEQDISVRSADKTESNVINQNLFVGSTAELMEILEKAKENENNE